MINNKIVVWGNGRISGMNKCRDGDVHGEDRLFIEGVVKESFQFVMKNGGAENALESM